MAIIRHLGIIPDGNRRWAVKNKLAVGLAYFKSYKVLDRIIRELFEKEPNIAEVSVYLLSYENLLNRNKSELNLLFNMANRLIGSEIRKYQKLGFKINWVGLKDVIKLGFDQRLYSRILKTLHNMPQYSNRGTINVVIGYSAERDIAENFSHNYDLVSNLEIQTPIDCIIRTGNKNRLSGFLPYHTKYSSLYFIDKLLPDLTSKDIFEILRFEEKQEQNYGK